MLRSDDPGILLDHHPANRPQLEESWRLKVEVARERYQAATKQYREALLKQREGLAPDPDDSHAMMLAREAESRAIAEYERVLLIFRRTAIAR
jgi:hypothetical protein